MAGSGGHRCRKGASSSGTKTSLFALLILGSVSTHPSAEAGSRTKSSTSYPPLSLFEGHLITSARDDFNGSGEALAEATHWTGERLRAWRGTPVAPHVACAEYDAGREAVSLLQDALGSTTSVQPLSHSAESGACFVVTASQQQGSLIQAEPDKFGLVSFGPFPSALKLVPGLVDYNVTPSNEKTSERLRTTHGERMRMRNVEGLNLQLSPGLLPQHDPASVPFVRVLLDNLMSSELDLHATNFWSDATMLESEDGHLARPDRELRAREWRRAATVVHGLSDSANGVTPGDVCSWGALSIHHADNGFLLVSGSCTFNGVVCALLCAGAEGLRQCACVALYSSFDYMTVKSEYVPRFRNVYDCVLRLQCPPIFVSVGIGFW